MPACILWWNEDLSPLFLKILLNAIFENQYRVMTRHIHQVCLFLLSRLKRCRRRAFSLLHAEVGRPTPFLSFRSGGIDFQPSRWTLHQTARSHCAPPFSPGFRRNRWLFQTYTLQINKLSPSFSRVRAWGKFTVSQVELNRCAALATERAG